MARGGSFILRGAKTGVVEGPGGIRVCWDELEATAELFLQVHSLSQTGQMSSSSSFCMDFVELITV